MFAYLPPTISRLILLFLFASPLLTLATAMPTPDAVPAPVVGTLDSPSKLQPRSPMPSKRMGQRKVKKSVPLKKKDYSSFLCPGGSVACPIPPPDLSDITAKTVETLDSSLNSLADWFKVGFECVELDSELNSCGGCLALGAGQDCTAIPNARATGCERSSCAVYSCFDGYVVSPDRLSCVKRGTATPATPITAVNMGDQVILGDGPLTP